MQRVMMFPSRPGVYKESRYVGKHKIGFKAKLFSLRTGMGSGSWLLSVSLSSILLYALDTTITADVIPVRDF